MPVWTKTQKGKVVYERAKHDFTLRDVLRIGHKVGAEIFEIKEELFQEVLEQILLGTEVDTAFRFGSGAFGGGGATRAFGSEELFLEISTDSARAIILVETI